MKQLSMTDRIEGFCKVSVDYISADFMVESFGPIVNANEQLQFSRPSRKKTKLLRGNQCVLPKVPKKLVHKDFLKDLSHSCSYGNWSVIARDTWISLLKHRRNEGLFPGDWNGLGVKAALEQHS